MGLDMYLFGRRSFWLNNDEDMKQAKQREALLQAFPELAEHNIEISMVRAEMMYWRKANAIHQWFVANVQNGVDECQTSYVSRDDLALLLAAINRVIDNPDSASAILPTSSGFFFGSQDYGDYYFRQLQQTGDRFSLLLSPAFSEWSFEYHASW